MGATPEAWARRSAPVRNPGGGAAWSGCVEREGPLAGPAAERDDTGGVGSPLAGRPNCCSRTRAEATEALTAQTPPRVLSSTLLAWLAPHGCHQAGGLFASAPGTN